QFRLAWPGGQVREHLSLGGRRCVFKVVHRIGSRRRLVGSSCPSPCGRGIFAGQARDLPHGYAFFFNASSTRCGSRGIVGTRTPMALATALLIAAPGLITGGSPRPITPRFRWSSGSKRSTTISGTSPKRQSL